MHTNTSASQLSRPLPWIALTVLLLGSAFGASARDHDGFPDPARAYPRAGTFVDVEALRQYAPGMNKEQVQALLGVPHFNEGMWGVREWNYLLNVRPAVGAEPIRCQLQIDFDGHGVARDQRWAPSACSALLEPPPAAPVAAAPAPAPAPVQPMRLSADALFDFNSAELKPGGRDTLRELVRQVGDVAGLNQVSIVGHSDRIGDDAYNLALSRRRAEAVRAYLAELGIPASSVHVAGLGASDPLVQCPGSRSAQVIDCLAPNRRVEITGMALRAAASR